MEKAFNSGMNRRHFLQVAGGTIACCAFLPSAEFLFGSEPISKTPLFPKGKADVALVFTHIQPGNPTWPTKDYDYDARAAELAEKLKQSCPKINFAVKSAKNAAEAEAIVKSAGDIDGYLVYVIGIWTGAPNIFMRSGKPVVMVDDLYAGSGEVLIMNGRAKREKLPLITVSSSDFNDVISAARLFEVLRAMKESTILDIVDYDISEVSDKIKDFLGTKVVKMGSEELSSYYAKADEAKASEWADLWLKKARKMVEPTRKDLVDSGKMYLALCRAAEDKRADAVTVDCLGMFYSGRITAYPCFSHFQMNNDGSTGVCEGDLNSTCTQLMMRYLTGRPGYVSDPVIDTSKDEIIYAHCVATNRVFGPGGKANPYIIRSHAEDGKGASIQSLLPLHEVVTSLNINVWNKKMVIHTAKTVRNVEEPKACRTKLAAKTSAGVILDNWDMGWHRVTFYGDWREQAISLARLLGMEFYEEDKA
jgi:hypothetical protein